MTAANALTLALACAVLSACADADVTPDRFLVYDLDGDRGYRLVPARMETLTHPRRGRGAVAMLRGGGDLVLALREPESEQEWLEALTVRGHHKPDIRFTVDDGVGVPWDFHSAMMLTLYHHLERASARFETAGVSLEEVRRLKVHYFIELEVPFLFFTGPLFTDNAAYLVTLDALIVPPRRDLDAVPLFANRGVITHEYSHAVFNRLTYGDERVPPFALSDWPRVNQNELRSLDEGIADFFGALDTGDPDFLAASILDDHDLEVDRDLSVERHYDDGVRFEVTTDSLVDYDPYALGSVVASALWAVYSNVGDDLAPAVIAALRRVGPARSNFELVEFFDALVVRLPAAERSGACAIFADRLDAVAADLACTP